MIFTTSGGSISFFSTGLDVVSVDDELEEELSPQRLVRLDRWEQLERRKQARKHIMNVFTNTRFWLLVIVRCFMVIDSISELSSISFQVPARLSPLQERAQANVTIPIAVNSPAPERLCSYQSLEAWSASWPENIGNKSSRHLAVYTGCLAADISQLPNPQY